jgi:foldase protein PrsA
MKKFLIIALTLIAIGSLAANVLLYRRYSTSRPIMRMGESQITRKEYEDQLDYQFGRQVLTQMAYAKLIEHAAAKAGIHVTDAQVDERIAEMRRSNPKAVPSEIDLDRFQRFKEEAKTALQLEGLRVKDVKVSDAEITAFYNRYHTQLQLPMQLRTTMVLAETERDARNAQQMLDKHVAPDVMARQPGLRVTGVGGYQPNWALLPAAQRNALTAAVKATPVGSTRTVPVGGSYAVFRVDNRSAGGTPPLTQIQDRVARLVRLSKAPSSQDTIARLYKEAKVTFEVPKYSVYFSDIEDYIHRMDDPANAKPGAKKMAMAGD